MNARRGRGSPPRWLVMVLLAINLIGIAGIALYTRDPHRVALGAVPLSMLLAVLP